MAQTSAPMLRSLVRELSGRLKRSQVSAVSDTALLDVQVAAEEVLGVDRTWILAHPEYELTPSQADSLRKIGFRLEAGEPLPYILGHYEFYGLDFSLNPAVLIPRPETELLVEQALRWMLQNSRREKDYLALDAGTGSGCIAVSLAVRQPRLKIIAVDISAAAVRTAQENARIHDVDDRVHCLQVDLVPRLSDPFELVCANLPYIPSKTLEGLEIAKWEPALALDGGPDGLDLIRRLLMRLTAGNGCTPALAPESLVLLEIEATQGAAALRLVREVFPGAKVLLLRDLAGHERLLRIELHPE